MRLIASALSWGDKLGALFTGMSLGSILLLVALGLAITYGLMGVINMAHGELMMIGAYATFVVQQAIRAWAPGLADSSLLLALPAAFLSAGAIGSPPAVINAVVDALAEFGIKHIEMPATPEKLWRIIDEAQRKNG